MTACIHLVRHCEHLDYGRTLTGRRDGVPLSAEGEARAQRLATSLAARGEVAAIHASPRLRAQQTAEILADKLGLEVETVDALDEIDFGSWTGSDFDTLDGDPQWRRWNEARSSATPPGGESMAAAVTRAADHVARIAEAAPERPVVCVSHCDIIRGVVAHHLGLGLDNMLRFDVDPGSVSTLVAGAWGSRLLKLNGDMA